MYNTLEICNGAFKAELVKGENGKKKWQYTPTYKKSRKKVKAIVKKEWPQFKLIEVAEKEEVDRYNETLKTTVLEITKYLTTCK